MRIILIGFLIFICVSSCSFCEKFSFAVFGDNRENRKVICDLLDIMKKDRSIEFAFNTGDITHKGTKEEFNFYWSKTAAFPIKIYDVMGNHDLGVFGEGRKIFQERYGSTYYFIDKHDCRFIVIDNASSKGLGSQQWKWIKDSLRTDKKIFVILHRPLYDPSGMYPDYGMLPVLEKNRLKKMLVDAKVKYIFCGHIHGYGREAVDGVVFVLTAGAGAPLYLPYFNGGFHNYVKLTVDGGSITDEVVQVYND